MDKKIIIQMDKDIFIINEALKNYIEIIFKDYGCYISNNYKIRLNGDEKLLKWNYSNTISFIVKDGVLNLPYICYQVFAKLKKLNQYGIRKKSYDVSTYLDINTTYFQYINEVIECGLLPVDYFLESLLHEAMHLCGSTGGTPLEEGINELKTRELAQKEHINIAAMGYSKEVEIAKSLQELMGIKIMDQLTFVPINKKYEFIKLSKGAEYAELYANLSKSMTTKCDYTMFKTSDPFEKAKVYLLISYKEEKERIKLFMDNISQKQKLF